jgi:hypothetical protein
MLSFVSRFHLPRHGGAERVAREKAAAEEKKWLRCERVRKHKVYQKLGVSPSDDDDDGDDDEDTEDEDLDVAVLDALQGFGDIVGPSGASFSAVASDGSAAQKRPCLSPSRGSSPKCSCATMGGGRSSLSSAHVDPSLVGDEVPIQGEDVEDTAATRAMLGANGTGHRSSEGSGGKDGDPLWLPIVCVETTCPTSSVPCLEVSETVEAEAARGAMWELLVPPWWLEKPHWLLATVSSDHPSFM